MTLSAYSEYNNDADQIWLQRRWRSHLIEDRKPPSSYPHCLSSALIWDRKNSHLFCHLFDIREEDWQDADSSASSWLNDLGEEDRRRRVMSDRISASLTPKRTIEDPSQLFALFVAFCWDAMRFGSDLSGFLGCCKNRSLCCGVIWIPNNTLLNMWVSFGWFEFYLCLLFLLIQNTIGIKQTII